MQISVIICTWNRCDLLRATLESLCSVIVSPGQNWELVIVDNNSTDDTELVVRSFEERLPVRYILEEELGISKARNTAVQSAKGELLLFVDDDVRVEPLWMQAYIEAAKQQPQALYFGGIIRPAFSSRIPAWVERNQSCLNGMLCCLDVGPEPRPFSANEFPFGPNMALRRGAFSRAHFSEQVGRKGNEHIRGSETSLFRALERAGAAGMWVPGAEVHHHILSHQTHIGYLWSYYYGQGRTMVRLGLGYEKQSQRHLAGVVLKSLARLCFKPCRWPLYLSHVARMSGQYYETRQRSLERARKEFSA